MQSPVLRVQAAGVDYLYEGNTTTNQTGGTGTKQTARLVLCVNLTGIIPEAERIVGMNIDFGITAEGTDGYDVTIDSINPDMAGIVTVASYTIHHEAEEGLEPSISTSAGLVYLSTTKYTKQWTAVGERRLEFTVDRGRNRAKVQLRNNLGGNQIPRDYRILVKVVKISDGGRASVPTGALGRSIETPAFPFTLTFGDTRVVFWKNINDRVLAICRMGHPLPGQSYTFNTTHNKASVVDVCNRTLGLVEALRTMDRN